MIIDDRKKAEKQINLLLISASLSVGSSLWIFSFAMASLIQNTVEHPGVENIHEVFEFLEFMCSSIIIGCAVFNFGTAMLKIANLKDSTANN